MKWNTAKTGYGTVLFLLLFSCGKEQPVLNRLQGKWKAVSKTEHGIESVDTGNVFMFYRFAACHAGNTSPVSIGIMEAGQSHEFDTENYRVSQSGKTLYFSGYPWDILLLDSLHLHIRNRQDSLELKFEKM